jgi:Tol biopolymer transport system component
MGDAAMSTMIARKGYARAATRLVLPAAVLIVLSAVGAAQARVVGRPAAHELVFVRGGDLWAAQADGSGQTQLTATPGLLERYPAWVPSSTARHVVYSAEVTPTPPAPAAPQLHDLDLDSLTGAQLTTLPGLSDGCNGVGISTVSGDGSRIAFDFRDFTSVSMWWQTPVVYSMSATTAGAVPRAVSFTGARPAQPAWWKASDYLAVAREDTGDDYSNIWIKKIDHPPFLPYELPSYYLRSTHVSAPGQWWTDPAFSPSGEWLVASYQKGASRGLYKMRFDGSSKWLLQEAAGRACFSDDGKRVYFEGFDTDSATQAIYSVPVTATPVLAPTLVATDAAQPALARRPITREPILEGSPWKPFYSPVHHGGRYSINATLTGGPPGAIKLYRRPVGSYWRSWITVVPGRDVAVTIDRRTQFYGVYAGSPSAQASASNVLDVDWRPRVIVHYSRTAVPVGGRIDILGEVYPARPGAPVVLQRYIEMRGWVTFQAKRFPAVGGRSRFALRFQPGRAATWVLRVYMPPYPGEHRDAETRPKWMRSY